MYEKLKNISELSTKVKRMHILY